LESLRAVDVTPTPNEITRDNGSRRIDVDVEREAAQLRPFTRRGARATQRRESGRRRFAPNRPPVGNMTWNR
jgi:hypothetical protein